LRAVRRYHRTALRARKPGRYLAPLALLAVIVATVLVVRAGVGTTHPAAATTAHHLPVTHHVRSHKRFYVIRAGDSLSSISLKTGISMTELEALNPSINPNALQTGGRLRLRH
jgi:spore germination protein YaaH